MKKQLMVLFTLLLAGTVATYAQGGGGFRMRTVEERVKAVHEKFDSTFHLDAAKQTQVDSVFAAYYRTQDKFREEMMAGGGPPDRDAMRTKMQEFSADRDGKLKGILTEEQMKKWKEEVEPSMRPQRPGGGGMGGGRN